MNSAKQNLTKILRKHGPVFNVAEASHTLDLSGSQTSKILSRWVQQGRLVRLRRGLYQVVPLDALSTEVSLEDPLILVSRLFGKSYLAGWSAAEHWGLTEQIYRDYCVVTQEQMPSALQTVAGFQFVTFRFQSKLCFGTTALWVDREKIQVSDPSKTLIDMFHIPAMAGGGRPLLDCFKQYLQHEHKDLQKLCHYGLRMQNGALFKRLGFCAEKFLGEENLVSSMCRSQLTSGFAYLDPAVKTDCALITRWRLYVPKAVTTHDF